MENEMKKLLEEMLLVLKEAHERWNPDRDWDDAEEMFEEWPSFIEGFLPRIEKVLKG